MNYKEALAASFSQVIREFHSSPGMRRLFAGELESAHYAAYLRETFHYTRENPQIQALATVFFRGNQRAAVAPFLRHALSETGHDQLALNDLIALGTSATDTEVIRRAQPLPATTALIAYPYYQIYNLNAAGYLGYLYFLEFMPTGFGVEYRNALLRMGVPQNALSFLHDHSTVDVGHNRLMEDYITLLLRDSADLQSAIYAMRVTASLYANLVEDAFNSADGAPNAMACYGINPAEVGNARTDEAPPTALAGAVQDGAIAAARVTS